MLQVNVKITGLDKLIKNFKQAPRIIDKEIDNALNKSINLIERNVKKRTPVGKSGFLRASIGGASGWRWVRGWTASIGTSLKYAIYVHDRTRPHIILPKQKQALSWKGAKHPVKSVQHPGTKAQPFMSKGVAASLSGIRKIFEQAMQRAVNKITKR